MAIFDDARKLEMYRFFLVAFNAAPGLTYLAQLQQAVESGLSTREIVNIFTTKQQFTSVYPESLSHTEFASRQRHKKVKTRCLFIRGFFENN